MSVIRVGTDTLLSLHSRAMGRDADWKHHIFIRVRTKNKNLLLQDFMGSCAAPFHCLTPAEAEGLVPPGLFGL